MKLEQLDFYLERGDTFGFIKTPENEGCFGWIILSKTKVYERLNLLFKEDGNAPIMLQQKEKKDNPYIVEVCEITKKFYASEHFPISSDYKIDLANRFSSLQEVQLFMNLYDKHLGDIKWAAEIPML